MNGRRCVFALGLLAAAGVSAQQSFDADYGVGDVAPLAGAGPNAIVYEKGEGTPVIFYYPADQRWWQLQIEPFAERYRAVAVGYGPDAPPPKDIASPAQLIVALEALRGKLGVERVNLVTHSISARQAMELAIARPDLLNALVIEEPAWAPTPDMEPPLAAPPDPQCGLDDPNPVDLETCLFFSLQMGPGRFEAMPAAMRDYFLDGNRRAASAQDGADQGGAPPSVWQPRVICDELGKLDLPILVVRGEDTPAFFQAGLDYYEHCLPPHDTEFFSDATHMAHFENPDDYNRAVMAFFDRIQER
jgi:pimeloyl-ACP methyl ester carboxylesterase